MCMYMYIHTLYVQDLTHKLCEALSLAAGCSPLPSSHDSPLHARPPPPHLGDVQTGPEDFEVVEHSDLHRKHQVYNHLCIYITCMYVSDLFLVHLCVCTHIIHTCTYMTNHSKRCLERPLSQDKATHHNTTCVELSRRIFLARLLHTKLLR